MCSSTFKKGFSLRSKGNDSRNFPAEKPLTSILLYSCFINQVFDTCNLKPLKEVIYKGVSEFASGNQFSCTSLPNHSESVCESWCLVFNAFLWKVSMCEEFLAVLISASILVMFCWDLFYTLFL